MEKERIEINGKTYKVTEYNVDGVRVRVLDPSSNAARQARLEKACIKFMDKVIKDQIEKEMAQAATCTKPKEITTSFF